MGLLKDTWDSMKSGEWFEDVGSGRFPNRDSLNGRGRRTWGEGSFQDDEELFEDEYEYDYEPWDREDW